MVSLLLWLTVSQTKSSTNAFAPYSKQPAKKRAAPTKKTASKAPAKKARAKRNFMDDSDSHVAPPAHNRSARTATKLKSDSSDDDSDSEFY